MLEINLALIGIFFSILFSSSEIALISASKLQIDVWIKQNYRLAALTKYIIVNKSKFLTVSLIGTNLSNILLKLTPVFTILFLIEKMDFGLPVIENCRFSSFSFVLIGFENFEIYLVLSSLLAFSFSVIAL